MINNIPEKFKIQHYFVAKRVNILGVAILLGIVVIYISGFFTTGTHVYPDLLYLNFVSLGICTVLCLSAKTVKTYFLKKVNHEKFLNGYFNALIIPLAMCDFGGLFCVSTSVFVNEHLIISSAGLIISLLCIFLILPKETDLNHITFQ